MENWKEVESKGMCLLVSPDGRIKTTAHTTAITRIRNGKQHIFTASFEGRELSKVKTKTGYLEVYAMKNGVRIRHLVHRLIGMAFVPGYAPGLTINHIDGNKLNNTHENLEWVSFARNTQHQWETGLVNLRGENQPGSKLTSKQVVYIRRLLAKGIPAHTLAVIAGVSSSAVTGIRDGRTWAHVPDADFIE